MIITVLLFFKFHKPSQLFFFKVLFIHTSLDIITYQILNTNAINMSELDASTLANLDANTRKEIVEWMESENSKSKVQMCK